MEKALLRAMETKENGFTEKERAETEKVRKVSHDLMGENELSKTVFAVRSSEMLMLK